MTDGTRRIDDYRVISGSSPEQVARDTKEFINSNNGYELVGGITADVFNTYCLPGCKVNEPNLYHRSKYFQCVVKYQ